MRTLEICFGLACCVVVERVSDSRTAVASILLSMALFYINARIKSQKALTFYYTVLTIFAIGVIFVTYCAMIVYEPNNLLWKTFDGYLSGRLYWAHHYFVNYPPSFLGQDVSVLPELKFNEGRTVTTFLVDNAFARTYLLHGPVASIFVVVATIGFVCKGRKAKNSNVVLVGFVVMVAYGFAEGSFMKPEINIFMLVGFSWLLYKSSTDTTLLGSANRLT